MKRWNDVDLETRLCRVLDLAQMTLEHFGRSAYPDEDSPAHSFGPDKPVAETAMLVYAVSALRDRTQIAKRVDGLIQMLIPLARAERVFAEIALHPARAFKFAAPHILLKRLGFPDDAFDLFLRACLESHASRGYERTHWLSIERSWLLSLWTNDLHVAPRRADLLDSLLDCSLDMLGGERDDAYVFTHLVMYSTDFGFRVPRLPRSRSSILHDASSLLAKYLDAEDYDLTGEILLSWPFMNAAWSPQAAFAFRVLAQIEDEVGLLPCGQSNPARLDQLEGGARTRYALATAYHTAYVMGFLCAASLRVGRAPPTTIGGALSQISHVEKLLQYLDADQGHWHAEFGRLQQSEQRALAPFVLDIAISQKWRKRDYQTMSELVALACEYGIASSSLCAQAAQMLERITVCCGAWNSSRIQSTNDAKSLAAASSSPVRGSGHSN